MRVRSHVLVSFVFFCSCRCEKEKLLDRVELAGCREVLIGPVCEIEDATTLRVFVKAEPNTKLSLRADDELVHSTWTRAGDGVIAELQVTPSTRTIRVEARRKGTDRWDRSLTTWKRPDLIREAMSLFRDGKHAEATAALARTATTGDPRFDGELEKLRGLFAMSRGEGPAAIHHWTRSAELAKGAGVISKELNDRLAIVHGAIFISRDLELARSMLEALDPQVIAIDPRGTANFDHYRGVLAFQTGDFRGALSAFEAAELTAARFNIELTSWSSKLERAEALIALGNYDRALQVLAQVHEHPVTRSDPCSEANLLGREAWAGLMAREAGQSTPIDPRRTIDRGLELTEGACKSPAAHQDWLTNLVIAATQEGDYATARATIARIKSLSEPSPLNAAWIADSEARIALSERSFAGALQAYARLSTIDSPEAAWRARLGRANVFRAEGRVADALAEYRAAEKMLDEQSLAVSVLSGRSRFLAARDGAIKQQIEVLLDAKMDNEAIAAMRRAGARAISGLRKELRVASFEGEARRRWERALSRYGAARTKLDELSRSDWTKAKSRADEQTTQRSALEREMKDALDDALRLLDPHGDEQAELRGAEDGELVLGYMRLPRGWMGFALTTSASRVARIHRQGWLEPFRDLLAQHDRVRILTGGELAGVELHAMLIDTHEVRYSIDLPRSSRSREHFDALIVADPNGDLPNARDEAELVRAHLSDRPVETLLGREASRERVLERLARSGTFHYAGHGRFAGEDGWESSLPLAERTELTVGDILALPEAPRRVMLSGCETAETSTLAGQQLGLAQAFVLAGSVAVVATTRPVKDATAKMIAERVHLEATESMAHALWRAQQHLKKVDSTADWAAFRVIVP